jgi:hypothetical protein
MMNVIISLSFFIAPWFLTIAVSPQSLLIIKTTRDDFYLLESNTNAYTRIIKRIFALNSHYSTSSNTGKLAFLLGQSGCPRKIDFNNIARLNRRYHRNRYTPILLILELLPLKNLLAFGNQTLTGQDRSVLLSMRCSVIVSMISVSFQSRLHL